MTTQPHRRSTDHPDGHWAWVKGPPWWREMPQVWKALFVIALASMAGATAWATASQQFGLPALVYATVERVDTLQHDVTNLQAVVPILESNYQRTLIESDKGEQRWQYTWCLIEGDPLSACRRLLSVEDQRMLMRNMQDGDDSHD